MSVVMDQLCQDHTHIGRLLDFVDREIEKAGTPDKPDFGLLRDIMEYVTRYPDIYHHPLEDQLFAELRGHPDVGADEVAAIQEEHKELLLRGQTFLEALELLALASERIELFSNPPRARACRSAAHAVHKM